MVASFPDLYAIRDPNREDDEHETEDRLTYVEREFAEIQQRLRNLLAYIRQDDMAPLTPVVRPLFRPKDEHP